MLRNLQQVLQLLMLLVRRRKAHLRRTEGAGGLLVLLWAEPGTSPNHQLNWTVAAAGPWCFGVKVEDVQQEFWQKLAPSATPCPAPNPEELCGFTDMYGPLHFFLSFQAREGRQVNADERSQTEVFLHRLSLTNAAMKIHLELKLDDGKTYQRIFSGKAESKVRLKDQIVFMDVACHTQPPVGNGPWCQRGHAVLGAGLSLLIPPEVMERGLYGELSLLPVTMFTPCVQHYPNLATRLTQIQVLLYSPSNLPLLGHSAFLQQLPAYLACQELGLSGLTCTTTTTHTSPEPFCNGILYPDSGDRQETEPEWSPAVGQILCLFLFLQHSDPFHSQLSDFVASEEVLECHLEDILRHNREGVVAALNTVLQNALKDQQQRQKAQVKMCSALRVMLSSVGCVVSSSSNVDFRNACLESMMVRDTRELSASLQESLKRVTTYKYVPSSKCYLGQGHKPW